MTQEEILQKLDNLESRLAHTAPNGWHLWKKILAGSFAMLFLAAAASLVTWGEQITRVEANTSQIERNRQNVQEVTQQQYEIRSSLTQIKRQQQEYHEAVMELLREERRTQ